MLMTKQQAFLLGCSPSVCYVKTMQCNIELRICQKPHSAAYCWQNGQIDWIPEADRVIQRKT